MGYNIFDHLVKNSNKIKELPFFHSTEIGVAEDIEALRFEMRAGKIDSFHQKEKNYFFYGNPVYYQEHWDEPVIFGGKFKNMTKLEVTPFDSGFIAEMIESDNFDSKSLDFYKDLYLKKIDSSSTSILMDFIWSWFGSNNSYIKGEHNTGNIRDLKKIKAWKHFSEILNYKIPKTKLISEKFIKENNLDIDIRKNTLEITTEQPFFHLSNFELEFVAFPDTSLFGDKLIEFFTDNGQTDIIDKTYAYQEEDRPCIEIIKECQKVYYDKFNLNS